MAGCADDMPAGRVVLGEDATKGQHHDIPILPFDITAGIRLRMSRERTNAYRGALEQRAPDNRCSLTSMPHGPHDARPQPRRNGPATTPRQAISCRTIN